MSSSDKDWVERCLDGHPEDYRHLVERYQGVILSYLRGRLDQGSDADDAAQETFVRAFFSLARLRKPESFLGWVLGIARRVTEESRRHRRRRFEVASEAALRRERERGSCRQDWDVPLERAIAGLPDTYRDLVLLRYYAGLTCAEVAARLRIPLGTVTKNLSRAYALLRESSELNLDGASREDMEVRP